MFGRNTLPRHSPDSAISSHNRHPRRSAGVLLAAGFLALTGAACGTPPDTAKGAPLPPAYDAPPAATATAEASPTATPAPTPDGKAVAPPTKAPEVRGNRVDVECHSAKYTALGGGKFRFIPNATVKGQVDPKTMYTVFSGVNKSTPDTRAAVAGVGPVDVQLTNGYLSGTVTVFNYSGVDPSQRPSNVQQMLAHYNDDFMNASDDIVKVCDLFDDHLNVIGG